MLDCCIVSMPYGALCFPSLGIGQLMASLRQADINAEDVYASFWFAERIGLKPYVGICYPNALHLGELTFSAAAFPDFQPDFVQPLQQKMVDNPEFGELIRYFFDAKDIVPVLTGLREQAVAFVNDAAARIVAKQPVIVGCSSMFEQHCASLALLRKIKELRPETVTIMGGANCEGVMGATTITAFPWLDLVVSGEADLLLPELVKRILESGPELDPATLPAGVLSRHSLPLAAAQGIDCGAAIVAQLDELPYPDYHGYFEALGAFSAADKVFPALPMESSRGCGWGQHGGCTFCGLNGHKQRFRSKSAARVSTEIRELYDRYGLRIKVVQVTDNMFPPEYSESLLPELRAEPSAPYTIYWPTLANLNEQQLQGLAAANVRLITPGIESLHNGALKLMNKPTDAITNVSLLKHAMELGISLWWIFLHGIPGEDPAWYAEMVSWLDLIFHLQPPRRLSRISYHRFSAYQLHPERYGLDLAPRKAFGQYVYPLPEHQIADLVYYFEDRDPARAVPVDSAEHEGLRAAIRTWQQLFSQYSKAEQRVVLNVHESEDASVITDTRPCAPQPAVTLTGPLHLVHRACRAPVRRSSLATVLERSGSPLTAEVLDSTVAQLIEAKLLLRLNGKLLSLALREPVSPMLKTRDCVMGFNIDGRLI